METWADRTDAMDEEYHKLCRRGMFTVPFLDLMVCNDLRTDPVMLARALLDEEWGYGLARIVEELSVDGDRVGDVLGDVHVSASDEELVGRLAVAIRLHQDAYLLPGNYEEHKDNLDRLHYYRGMMREDLESPDTQWSRDIQGAT